MKIAREGYPFAMAGGLLAGACWIAVQMDLAGEGAGGLTLQVTAWAFTGLSVFVLWFFRDPEPALTDSASAVVSPGQGKVLLIEDVEEPTLFGGPARKISIFLSVFDVHVQRSPASGTVSHKVYRPGAYAVAWADKASEDNEMCSLGIEAEHGTILVRQIAGLIARRIITDPSEGDRVERGRRFGLIRFGSRVDIFLPLHWEVACSVGDRVRVGSSVIAHQRPATPEAA